MAWTAKLSSRVIQEGKLDIEIIYTNGERAITDTIQPTDIFDENWLDEQIQKKLNSLESLDKYIDHVDARIAEVDSFSLNDTQNLVKTLIAEKPVEEITPITIAPQEAPLGEGV